MREDMLIGSRVVRRSKSDRERSQSKWGVLMHLDERYAWVIWDNTSHARRILASAIVVEQQRKAGGDA